MPDCQSPSSVEITQNAESQPATKHTKDQDQRRGAILSAATALFSQKGFQATTVAEIAEAANLSVGTLYKFFKDKESLYHSLLEDTLKQFDETCGRALRETEGDEIAKIVAYITTGTHLFFEQLPIIRVYYAETAAAFVFSVPADNHDAFTPYWQMMDSLQETIQSGIDRGLFVDLPAGALARALEGVHNSFLATLIQGTAAYSAEEIVGLTRRIFFESVALQQ